MKKVLVSVVALSFCVFMSACANTNGESDLPEKTTLPTEDSANIPDPPQEENPVVSSQEELSPEEQVDAALRSIVDEHYASTDIAEISINENLGTDEEGDFIALVYLTWNVKNKPDMTKQMLAMYSEDFAARVGSDISDISELTLFWTVPYYSESDTAAKYSYSRVEDGMVETEATISSIVS